MGYIVIIRANRRPNFNKPLIVHANKYNIYIANINVPKNVTPDLSISTNILSKNICLGIDISYSVRRYKTICKFQVNPNTKLILAIHNLAGQKHYYF